MIEKYGEEFYNSLMVARTAAMKDRLGSVVSREKKLEERKEKNHMTIVEIHKNVFGEEKEINPSIDYVYEKEYRTPDGMFVDVGVSFTHKGIVLKKNSVIRYYGEKEKLAKMKEKMYKEVYEYLS